LKKSNFSADRVAKFKCVAGKSQSLYWDGKQPGLGVRVTAGGARSYIFETRLNGRTMRQTIGNVRTWSLSDAQSRANKLKTLADQGIDLRQVEAANRVRAESARQEEKRKTVALRDAWPIYIDARKKKWGVRHHDDHVRLTAPGGGEKLRGRGTRMAGPLASLMPVLLPNLTGDRIAAWLEIEAATRPTNAALAYRLLRAFIRWASKVEDFRDTVPSGGYCAPAVLDALPKNQSKEGDCLQREQLPTWFSSIKKLQNPVMAAYLQGLLLTGARREELASLRWKDVDFKWRSITIRDKVEGERTIPLTPYFAHLLSDCCSRRQIDPLPEFY